MIIDDNFIRPYHFSGFFQFFEYILNFYLVNISLAFPQYNNRWRLKGDINNKNKIKLILLVSEFHWWFLYWRPIFVAFHLKKVILQKSTKRARKLIYYILWRQSKMYVVFSKCPQRGLFQGSRRKINFCGYPRLLKEIGFL